MSAKREVTPGPTVMQISGSAPSGEPILSVVAKRTYTLAPGRTLALAPEQLPLRQEPVLDPERLGLLVADADIYPHKLRTDVVVRGHVYGRGKTEMLAEIAVGETTHRVLVIGDRRVGRSGSTLTFSSPAPFDAIPLGWDRAYGGVDRAAEARHGHPLKTLAPYLQPNTSPEAYSPFAYPRNRHGRGYVCDPTNDTLDQLLLPNLEDPADRLTAERLVVPELDAWAKQPLPAGTAWVPPSHFGRGVFGGMFPFWRPLPAELTEVKRGLLSDDVRTIDLTKGHHPLIRRLANGAPLGLQLLHLAPGTGIRLVNLHPKTASLAFALPARMPAIAIDGRDGKLLETEPVIHHVEIEPDLGRVSIVWRGAGPARRAYHPLELARMPLRVDWPEARA